MKQPSDPSGCGRTFVSHTPEVVQQMPLFVQQLFPFVKRGKKWVTQDVVRQVRDTVVESGKMQAAAIQLESQHKGKHLDKAYTYYAVNKWLRQKHRGHLGTSVPPQFPAYDSSAYGGVKVGLVLTCCFDPLPSPPTRT
jgi:hypothetical protein